MGRAQNIWGSRMLYNFKQDTCFSGVRIWGGTFCRFYCEVWGAVEIQGPLCFLCHWRAMMWGLLMWRWSSVWKPPWHLKSKPANTSWCNCSMLKVVVWCGCVSQRLCETFLKYFGRGESTKRALFEPLSNPTWNKSGLKYSVYSICENFVNTLGDQVSRLLKKILHFLICHSLYRYFWNRVKQIILPSRWQITSFWSRFTFIQWKTERETKVRMGLL